MSPDHSTDKESAFSRQCWQSLDYDSEGYPVDVAWLGISRQVRWAVQDAIFSKAARHCRGTTPMDEQRTVKAMRNVPAEQQLMTYRDEFMAAAIRAGVSDAELELVAQVLDSIPGDTRWTWSH